MAKPQLRNGYTPIANELLEAIYKTNFTSTELKIIFLVMRCTYGFSRKEYTLSLSYIANGIGVSKRYVSSSVGKLIEDNVLQVVKEHTDTQSRILKLNKNYEEWRDRITIQQMNHSSTVDTEFNYTDEVQFNTTDEAQFNTTDEAQFNQKNNNKTNIKQYIDYFDSFWSLYPKKVAKSTAEKSFKKLKVNGELITKILNSLEIQKQSKQWQDRQYIPNPSTWLNQKRWEDEVEEVVRNEGLTITAEGTYKF